MLRIKKLDIFIAKKFILLFFATFFICLFVLMMQFLWKYVNTLIGKGLSMEVLAQFFWYMSLMLVPRALPLAILLSSLITYGNLGESSELTAIKSAGISLFQSFRSLIVIVVFVFFGSLYFQNVIGPNANMSFSRLLISMQQKSPELEIPEGIFYDGIPGCNLYVQKKDLDTGMLYGIMIYRMTDSYEDAAIILADSGMLQSTAEKKHLVLTLINGEWFENMKSQEFSGTASVPYRRETFYKKKIVLDFDADFNMSDANSLSNNAQAKSFKEIAHDKDSLEQSYDSIGRVFYNDIKRGWVITGRTAKDSVRAARMAATKTFNIDSLYAKKSTEGRLEVVNAALEKVNDDIRGLDYKRLITADGDKLIRQHEIENIRKVTLALSCILFFFIGAPLGAIIRKGGLGVPVIISVLVFIVYFIFDNSGYRMARGGMWTVWFGMSISTMVLTPLAIFVTYKANKDSSVFNIDAYKNVVMKMLGLRSKRYITRKEVIINDPDYVADAMRLEAISNQTLAYEEEHSLLKAPDFIKVFFKYSPDHDIEAINEDLEAVIEDLANTKDKVILTEINKYPFMTTTAHTRPFEHKWLNITAAVLIPIGVFLYFRMWWFRLRLMRDLRVIRSTNAVMIKRIKEITEDKMQ
ncbi:MAG: LptF/LptG family permease [Prevotella sp.]|nr:LptF/LptG family permease [Prevotella sp.]MBQ5606252.1 LptF/LptG family permease [Prevotella sp.]